jgi:ParB family transcriptional regulator, chromosome partitioning protein
MEDFMRGKSISEILLSDIVVNPDQPRSMFNEQSLHDLAVSIASHGLIQPIIVRQLDSNKFEIVAGERRYRAFELLGKSSIPAIVKEINRQNSSILALIENIQRDDLHYLEEAKGYDNLIKTYKWTQEELASTIGKSRSTIANKLRLLNFSPDILKKLMEYDLTERHARALLAIKSDIQILVAIEHIYRHSYSVKQTEIYVSNLVEKTETNKKNVETTSPIGNYIRDIRVFTNTIKQAIESINTTGHKATYNIRQESDHYTITIDIPMEK